MNWELYSQTRGQSANPTWFKERRKRITGTFAGHLMSSKDISKLSPPTPKNIDYLPSVKYGRQHEPIALRMYKRRFGSEYSILKDTGLCALESNSYVAASPDGLRISVPNGDIIPIEIKTLYQKDFVLSKTVGHSIQELTKLRKGFFLSKNGHLRHGHPYYGQVQLEIYCTEAKTADFVIYNPTNKDELVVLTISRDDAYINQLVTKAKSFFIFHPQKTAAMEFLSDLPTDPVSQLQVLSQRLHTKLPSYARDVLSEVWLVECHFGLLTTTGHGSSIKDAKHEAAEKMVENVTEIYMRNQSKLEVLWSMDLTRLAQPTTKNPLGKLYCYESQGALRNIKFQTHPEGFGVKTVLRLTTESGEQLSATGEGPTCRRAKEMAAKNMLEGLDL